MAMAAEVNPDAVYIKNLLLHIYDHFDAQELIDVTFKLSNPTALVPAHRLILSAASPYFRKLFKSEKGVCPLIEISEIDSDIFKRLITFCYTGETLITIDNVDQMLKAAIILQLEAAIANCADFIIHNITIYTLQRAYALNSETQNKLLSQKILDYVMPNFMGFNQSAECFNCAEQLFALNLDDLNGSLYQYNKTEDSWQMWGEIKHNVYNANVIVMNENLIISSPYEKNVKSWNFKTRTFKQLPSMDSARWGHSVVLLNDKIYAIGGEGIDIRTSPILRSVEMYSMSHGWQIIKNSMTKKRADAAAVIFHGKIYVLGGQNGSHKLKSAELYDPDTGCWTQIADMNEPRSCFAATVHNGHIYVLGGTRGEDHGLVERYDAHINKWTKICSLDAGNWGSGFISVYNQLWAIGGINHNVSNLVSVYDDENDKWTKKRPMPSKGMYYCFTVPKALLQGG